MNKPKIYIAQAIKEQVLEFLQQHCDCSRWTGPGRPSLEQLYAAISDVEGLLLTSGAVNQELLEHAPKLRAVSTATVGYNQFDLQAMEQRGIIGTHTPYVLDDTVADLVLGLMLSAARRIPELDAYVKLGKWQSDQPLDSESLYGMDVHHQKIGIIGMGRIGEAIAQRAVHGFGMELLYYNRTRKPEAEQRYRAKYTSLDKLLKEADFIVLMTPATPETKHYIRGEHFAIMKPTAFFINASRGSTVDEDALIEALQSGQIRGAALDVYEPEPPKPDHPFFTMPNVVTLPHIGSATAKTRLNMSMLAARNLVEALYGQNPKYVVPELRSLLTP